MRETTVTFSSLCPLFFLTMLATGPLRSPDILKNINTSSFCWWCNNIYCTWKSIIFHTCAMENVRSFPWIFLYLLCFCDAIYRLSDAGRAGIFWLKWWTAFTPWSSLLILKERTVFGEPVWILQQVHANILLLLLLNSFVGDLDGSSCWVHPVPKRTILWFWFWFKCSLQQLCQPAAGSVATDSLCFFT